MKGLNEISEATKQINQRDRTTWLDLYYSIKDDTAYTTAGEGRFFITKLINYNQPQDIHYIIDKFLNM